MRYEDLPLGTQKILREIASECRTKKREIPKVGDCFFLEAPTFRPMEEPDHALVCAILEERSALVCSKISMECDKASHYDYILRPDRWGGGYSAMVEVWNSVLFKPQGPLLIHARIDSEDLRCLQELFLLQQRGQLPPERFRGIGPVPADPSHPLWDFRAEESQVMERVRRHYHEGWDVKVIAFPSRPKWVAKEALMAASTSELASRIRNELQIQKQDLKILGPPEVPEGFLFLRRDETIPGYQLIWYSEQASDPPEVLATPPLEPPKDTSFLGIQKILGFWPDESLRGELVVSIKMEALSQDILVKLPKKTR